MAYVCMDCYEVYDMELKYCPKATCGGTEVVEIDDLMMPIIIELNQKGYCTDYCCSGHSYNYSAPYVAFNRLIEEIFEDGEFEALCENLPAPWHLEVNESDNRFRKFCLRRDIKDETLVEKYENIIMANLALLKFVEDLPDLEY